MTDTTNDADGRETTNVTGSSWEVADEAEPKGGDHTAPKPRPESSTPDSETVRAGAMNGLDADTRRRRFLAAVTVLVSGSLAGCEILESDGNDPSTGTEKLDVGSSTGGEGADVYAINPAPVVESRDRWMRTVFLDMHHRRVDSTVGESTVTNHAMSYGHSADDGAPRAPWSSPSLTAGVLSTPSTSTDGVGENPLATQSITELLVTAEGVPLRRTIGLGSDVEWVMTPTEIDVRTTTALGTDTQVHEFVGVVGNRSNEAQAQGTTPSSRIGVVTAHILRTAVDGTTVVLGLVNGWETQSLEPEDVDEQQSTREGITQEAGRQIERARSTLDDSAGALTKTEDDDTDSWEPPPGPKEESVTVSLGSSVGLTPQTRKDLGYPTEDSGTLENTNSYLTGRDTFTFAWDEDSFDRGTEYDLDIETVTRSYTVGGDDTFPLCVVTAPQADRHGAERNPLATEDIADLLAGSAFNDGLLEDALTHLNLYDGSTELSWKNGPTEVSSSAPTIKSAEVAAFEGTVTQMFEQSSDKDVLVYVARITEGNKVVVALLANVTTGDPYWGRGSNAKRVFKDAVNGITVGPGTLGDLDDLSVTDLRLVQTVENTRVIDGSSDPFSVDDPDLVAGDPAAPLYDVEKPATVPEFVVLETSIGGRPGSLRSKLKRETMETWLNDDLDPGAFFNQLVQKKKYGKSDNDPVVFDLATGHSFVSVAARAPSGYTYSSQTVKEGRDYEIVSVRPLRVGFIPVKAADPSHYGDSSGEAFKYERSVGVGVEYLRRVYPGPLHAYRHDTPIAGHRKGLFGNGENLDYGEAQEELQKAAGRKSRFPSNGKVYALGDSRSNAVSAIESNGFDVCVLIVPKGYNSHHNTDGIGMAPGNAALAVYATEKAGVTNERVVAHTVAQELGHRFVAVPYDVSGSNGDYPMAMRYDGDPNRDIDSDLSNEVDTDHARFRKEKDKPALATDSYDLTDGTFRQLDGFGIDPGSVNVNTRDDTKTVPMSSYMSYDIGDPVWDDAVIRQDLIDSGWSSNTMGGDVISALGGVTDDGEVELREVRSYTGGPITESDDAGEVTMKLLGPDGGVEVERTLSAGMNHHHGNDATNLVAFQVPFPDPVVEIRTRHEGVTTTTNPITRIIGDAVDHVPDRGFENDPAAVRDTLSSHLSKIDSLMADRAFDEAANRMETDVAGLLDMRIQPYEGLANQPSRERLQSQVAEMARRLRVAAELASETPSEDCTPGHTPGDPPCQQVADDAEVLTPFDAAETLLPVTFSYPCGWDVDTPEVIEQRVQTNVTRYEDGVFIDIQVRAYSEPVDEGFIESQKDEGHYEEIEYEYDGESRTGLVSAASTAQLGTLGYAAVPIQGELIQIELISSFHPESCGIEPQPDYGLVKNMLRSIEPNSEASFEPSS